MIFAVAGGGQFVDLVVDEDLRHVLGADFFEYALHFFDAQGMFGIGGIDDVQQQVRIARFRQRRLERGDEVVRQIANETDRVGEQHRAAGEAVETAQRRVEGREQLVGHVDARAGDLVEQRRLARIRVADQGRDRQRIPLPRTPCGVALGFDFFEALLELLHAPGKQAAIEFELGFAGTAQADRAAALALKVGPAAHKARRHVLQLGQLDLQLAFVRAGALGEDVEDEPGAVDDAALGIFFQIALLHRRERVIDQDQVGVERGALRLEFLGLAAADEELRVRLFDARVQRTDHGRPSRAREFAELVRLFAATTLRGITYPARLQKQRAFTFARTFEQGNLPFRGFRFGRGAGVAAFGADAHVAARHDRRDGVFVNHLAHGIAQKHDKLVERFDRSLQLDAIDQIDRDRNALTAQGIQKRILQRLTFGHSFSPCLLTNLCEPIKGASKEVVVAAPRLKMRKLYRFLTIPDRTFRLFRRKKRRNLQADRL